MSDQGFAAVNPAAPAEASLFLGLDVGSVSVDTVVLNGQGQMLFCDYARTQGRPLNAALEALGCGLPVVTTADTGLAREIAEEDAGAICMRDPADIADKILGISGKDRRDGMAARARQLAMAFDQDLVIGRWLDLYRARMAAHS